MAALECLPIRAEIFIPENKVSAWVSKNDQKVARDSSKEFQGVWVVDGYTLDKRKESTEIWIFYDNDERGIDRRVLENNPLQGTWGYAPGVNPRKAEIKDMWFFPPKSAKCKIPPSKQEYNHKGTWIKPIFKRDFSQLDANSSGFMTVSGNMRIAKGEKHSIGGKWNMLGFNDDVVRGRKKNKTDDSGKKGKWEIFVRKVDGSRFPISVIPGNKIEDCKKKVYAKKRIPVEDQRMSFNDTPLKDEKTLVGSGIRNGDTIDLGPMMIYVRTRKGKKFSFEVDQDELVKNVKPMVEKREGTPAREQRLYFKNVKLENGKPLSHYKVRHKSVLDLGPMIIFVKPNGSRPKIELDVEPTDTLKSVKQKVKTRTQMPVSEQRLYFEEVEMLSNSRDLQSYNVRHLDTLFMIEEGNPEEKSTESDPGMVIFVIKEWNNHKFKLRTQPTSTILEVKKMIEASENIPVDQQRLTFKKKSVYNNKTLEQSKIKNRSILHLGMPRELPATNPELEVTLPDKSKIMLPLLPTTKFSDIKDEVEEKNGIPSNKQRFFFLDDESNEPDDDLPVLNPDMNGPKPIGLTVLDDPSIEVKTPDGRSFVFDFDPDVETVDDLKQKVAKLTNMPIKDLALLDPNDDIVDEDSNLPRQGVVLNVAPQIDVVLPDKSKVTLNLLPKMTVDDLKYVIEEKTGTPRNERFFFFDNEGNELDDTIPLQRPGIEPGSVLEMRPPPPPPEEEKIGVRMPDGRTFFFDLDPGSDKMDDIKAKIARAFGIPVKNLPPLMLDDEELDDNYRPSRGHILDFEPTEIEVELPNKDRIQLTTLPTQTIGDIKDVVEEKTGLKRPDQRIFYFDDAGEEIDDDTMLMNAPPGTPLKICSPTDTEEPKEITIKDPSGRVFHFIIDPEETVGEFKERVQKKIGIPVGAFKLEDGTWDDIDDDIPLDDTVLSRNGGILEVDSPEIEIALPNSKKITLKILPTMTIRDVKDIIEEEAPELLTADKPQRMFFFDQSDELDDDTPFHKLNLDRGKTLELRSMMIKVQDEEGNCFEIDVESDWYIDDVRDRIQRLTNVAPEKQHISFNGEPVDDEISLIKQGIVHGSTLVLEPMIIYVNIPLKKKPVPFFVKESATIDSIKRKAVKKTSKKEKSPSSRNFSLMFGGQELVNSETLQTYQIQHEDVLTLEVFKVRIMHWTGDLIDLDGVKRNSTIASVKEQILETEGIPIDHQRLSLGGRCLRDGRTLEKEKVPHRSTLVLEPPGADIEIEKADKRNVKASKVKKFKSSDEWDEIMPVMPDWNRRIFFFDYENEFDGHIELVVMHWTGEQFTLDNILLKCKIKDIKKLIYKREGIKKEKQILKFNGKVLDDKRTLLDQNIGHRSILVLESPQKNKIATPSVERLDEIFSSVPTKLITNIAIKVRHWNGETFDLSPGPSDYIDDVKDLIHDLRGIPQEHLRISFNGQATEDVMTLKEQGIVDGSLLVLDPMQIRVYLPSKSEPFSLDVEMKQTISHVKKRLAKKVKLPVECQCVMFGGEELTNSRTIIDCGIEHDDEIRLETFEIQIMHWSGEKFSVSTMSPKSTTYELKSMISERQAIPVEQQVLLFKGNILNDVIRLKDQGIHHRDIVMLDDPTQHTIHSPVKEKVKLSLFSNSNEDGEPTEVGSDEEDAYFEDLRYRAGIYSSDDYDSSPSLRSSASTKSSTSLKSISTDGSFSSSKKKRSSKERKEKKKGKQGKTKKSRSDKGTKSAKRERSASSKGRMRRRKDSTKTME